MRRAKTMSVTSRWAAAVAICTACFGLLAGATTLEAQSAAPPVANGALPSAYVEQAPEAFQQLHQQVSQLETLQVVPPGLPDSGAFAPVGPPVASPEDTANPAAELPGGEGPVVPGSGQSFPLGVSYRYNAGGGYTQLASEQGEFTFNMQNLFALDGTFYDHANVNTSEKGFNLPYTRNYFFGNITKNIAYQLAFQESLGTFNVLDMWANFEFSEQFNVRLGRMVTPFLYEYYIFWPGWGPVITDSPLFQIAGHRREGAMAWGRLFGNKIQYQQGVFNASDGTFYDLGTGVDYVGAVDYTPFKGRGGPFDSLGGGVGVDTGMRNYSLAAGSTDNFVNGGGEPTTNNVYVSSSGVPFFEYISTMSASGFETRVAPHLYWYGRFSVLAEWAYAQRQLTNTANGVQATERVNGYYVTTSYFLTGERNSGDGLSGFGAVSPLRPFSLRGPNRGPGGWEIAFQYSQLRIGNNVVTAGFVDPLYNATQLNQSMLGVNWYVNKYVKFSFDWVNDQTNRAVPISSSGAPVSQYNIYWSRVALMF